MLFNYSEIYWAGAALIQQEGAEEETSNKCVHEEWRWRRHVAAGGRGHEEDGIGHRCEKQEVSGSNKQWSGSSWWQRNQVKAHSHTMNNCTAFTWLYFTSLVYTHFSFIVSCVNVFSCHFGWMFNILDIYSILYSCFTTFMCQKTMTIHIYYNKSL